MGSEHGYTYVGRYNLIETNTKDRRWDFPINDVFSKFGREISDVLSMGCSVGVNETLVAIQNPSVQFLGIDNNPHSIEIASSGIWPIDTIRPRVLAGSGDDRTLRSLIDCYCPCEYFELDMDRGTLALKRNVPNISFEVRDGRKTGLDPDSYDLIMMRGVTGYRSFGLEVERLLHEHGLYWNVHGLFHYFGNSDFRRVLNINGSYAIELEPADNKFLFPQNDDSPSPSR